MAAIASSDAKVALTAQLYDLEFRSKYDPKIPPDAGYVQAQRALKDLEWYDTWESSWLGPALGGWESKSELVRRFTKLSNTFKSQIPTQKNAAPPAAIDKALKAPGPQAMGAKTCKEDPEQAAIDKYGPFWGRFPGAQILTCHRTAATTVGITLVALLILATMSPYANLLGKMLPGRKRRR